MNTIKANVNLETEEIGANADDTSNKETMRKKARKGRKKARKDKRAREQDANTDEIPVHSPPVWTTKGDVSFCVTSIYTQF